MVGKLCVCSRVCQLFRWWRAHARSCHVVAGMAAALSAGKRRAVPADF